MKAILLSLLPLVGLSCAHDDQTGTPAKDVTFEIVAPCEDLTLNDYYSSKLLQSAHRSHVDTCWVEFRMPYGRHEIELTINGRTGRETFLVTDTTVRRYRLSDLTFGITIDPTGNDIIDLLHTRK